MQNKRIGEINNSINEYFNNVLFYDSVSGLIENFQEDAWNDYQEYLEDLKGEYFTCQQEQLLEFYSECFG